MEKTRFYVGSKGKPQNHLVDLNGMRLEEGSNQDTMRLEYWIAKQIGSDLVSKFKNRQWHVDVDAANKVVVISCPSLSKRMGYRLHMRRGECMNDLINRCRRAAGEILERFNVSRNRIVSADEHECLDRDIRDDVKSRDALHVVEKFNCA